MSGRWFGRCPGCGTFGTLNEEAPANGDERRGAPGRCCGSSTSRPRRRRGSRPASRAQPGARRRPRSRVGRARRRRARGRQVDACCSQPHRDLAERRRPATSPPRSRCSRCKLRADRLGGCRGGRGAGRRPSSWPSARTSTANGPTCCVIDSIQTVLRPRARLRAGLRRAGARGRAAAAAAGQAAGVATCLVGHVTKNGAFATTACSSTSSTPCSRSRATGITPCACCRAVKHRFGSTAELGLFEMADAGLLAVPDPTALFGKHSSRRGRRSRHLRRSRGRGRS